MMCSIYITFFILLLTNSTFCYFFEDPVDYPRTSNPSYDSSKFKATYYLGKYYAYTKQRYKYSDDFCESRGFSKIFIKTYEDFKAVHRMTTAQCK